MTGETAPDRRVFEIGGKDRFEFLQGLVTANVAPLRSGEPALVYAALLTPQGKYLADFFLASVDGRLLLDVKDSLSDDLLRRLAMYKLRADVTITPAPEKVARGLGEPPEGALPDPRHPALGWRLYAADAGGEAPAIDWEALRVDACVPESGIELVPGETFILEAGLDRLGGVDFRKGCYVGQEVTARMRHKTELRKGLVTVEMEGSAPPGSEITADGKPAGTLYTQAGNRALAFLRFDRATVPMKAGEAMLRWDGKRP